MTIREPAILLDRLIQERGEGTWLEFKENNWDPETIGRCVSACANGAILSGKDRAFTVFGVEDKSRKKVGSSIRISELKKGGENLINWPSRLVEPRLMIDYIDFDQKGKPFSIISVEPTYDRPVKFAGIEYIRIGENVKKLAEFPEHERSLWLATGRRKFESAIALTHQDVQSVLELFDVNAYYKLSNEGKPKNDEEIIRRLSLAVR